MHKKPLIISLVTAFILSLVFGYGLVLGKVNTYNGPIVSEFILSKNIYPESVWLDSTMIILKSGKDISDAKFTSKCDIFSKFVEKRNNYYIFSVKYFSTCDDNKIILKDIENNILFTQKLEFITEYKLWDKMIDYPTKNIEDVYKKSEKIIENYKKSLSWNNALKNVENVRKIEEVQFVNKILKNILEKRSEKYLIPVDGYQLPTKLSKIPNAWRPYREHYTDGIHHGWDVGSQLWEEVLALDDAMVVRVVTGFRFEDLWRIVYWEDLTEDQKIKNLDILRWNQVWLKTAKWDVVFYSHLQDIFPGVEEWLMVRKGQKVGTIGISGIPDKTYTDYHLHFPIHKNPLNPSQAGKYDYDDYMRWPWYLKEKNLYEVLEHQHEIFE